MVAGTATRANATQKPFATTSRTASSRRNEPLPTTASSPHPDPLATLTPFQRKSTHHED
ncbi:hypothetical protein ACFPRL_09470 [Pseudoclavibacter helvolus]